MSFMAADGVVVLLMHNVCQSKEGFVHLADICLPHPTKCH